MRTEDEKKRKRYEGERKRNGLNCDVEGIRERKARNSKG